MEDSAVAKGVVKAVEREAAVAVVRVAVRVAVESVVAETSVEEARVAVAPEGVERVED